MLDKLNLPGDVEEDDIKSMRSWLSSIKAFMDDRSGRQGSHTMLDRVDKVRKIAYDIEDVLDDFILHSPPYTFHSLQISRKIHNYAHQIHHGMPLRGVKEKIASIRKDIKQFKQQAAAFGDGDRDSSVGGTSTVRVSPLLLDEHMVGYEKQKEELMRRLVGGDNRLLRLAVDGPSGSGKTTLVKNVFWKPRIQAQFDCHAWVCVSQNFDPEKILENLLLQLCRSRREPDPADDGSNVQTRLQRYLAGKRYLVVLDDIWRHEDWSKFKNSLPDSNRGSRIIITTHNSSVSSDFASSSRDCICSLKALESLDGWKLFCRKAFPNTRECPIEVKDTAMRIVARCEGLPLAIVALAGALAQKPLHLHEWEKFHNNLGREIGSGSNLSAISDALLRSYMDLSSSLKCCFLYMSIFPEDYSVERGRLIRLWVAEGFAVATEDHTAEEVAEGHLNELVQRNLIHVSNWDFDGRPRNCRLLNIVLKFIIKKCKDENFASVFPRENSSQTQPVHNQSQMIRRLSVHDHFEHWPGNADLASVRSLLLLRCVTHQSHFF